MAGEPCRHGTSGDGNPVCLKGAARGTTRSHHASCVGTDELRSRRCCPRHFSQHSGFAIPLRSRKVTRAVSYDDTRQRWISKTRNSKRFSSSFSCAGPARSVRRNPTPFEGFDPGGGGSQPQRLPLFSFPPRLREILFDSLLPAQQ